MRFVAFAHGKGKGEHEKWGADLTQNELEQKAIEIREKMTAIYEEHDDENGRKFDRKTQVGKLINAWVDPQTHGLKVMGEIDTSTARGFKAWKRLQNREYVGTSLSLDHIIPLVSVDTDWENVEWKKNVKELSLTKDPLRKDALVTHIELDSDEYLDRKQKLKQNVMEEKLKRKQYNQSRSEQHLNTLPSEKRIVFPKMSQNSAQVQQPSSEPQVPFQSQSQPQSQSIPPTQGHQQPQPQAQPPQSPAQPSPQMNFPIPMERMQEALEMLKKKDEEKVKREEETKKATLESIDDVAEFLAHIEKSIDPSSKNASLKGCGLSEEFAKQAREDPVGMSGFVRILAEANSSRRKTADQVNEMGKLMELQKRESETRDKMRQEEFNRQLEDMKRENMLWSEKARLAASTNANSFPSQQPLQQNTGMSSFNNRFDTSFKTEAETGAHKFPKTRLAVPVMPSDLGPITERGMGALENNHVRQMFAGYGTSGRWSDYIPHAEIDQ